MGEEISIGLDLIVLWGWAQRSKLNNSGISQLRGTPKQRFLLPTTWFQIVKQNLKRITRLSRYLQLVSLCGFTRQITLEGTAFPLLVPSTQVPKIQVDQEYFFWVWAGEQEQASNSKILTHTLKEQKGFLPKVQLSFFAELEIQSSECRHSSTSSFQGFVCFEIVLLRPGWPQDFIILLPRPLDNWDYRCARKASKLLCS